MKATETRLIQFLNGLKQFRIPVYQRPYSWQRDQCRQLWADIVQIADAEGNATHFIGAVVYTEGTTYQASGVQPLMVIDGQQRLTTLSLLLAALVQAIKADNADREVSGEQIEGDYLFNNRRGDWKYKLVLSADDNPTFQRLLDAHDLPDNSAARLKDNYDFFVEQIKGMTIGLDRLFSGIGRLVLIDVALQVQHGDNPQLIFESLNSTGMELAQADLIRNYLLMGLEPGMQDRLYTDYWLLMERQFGLNDDEPQFDRFVRDYLTIKNRGEIPNLDAVYTEFKRYRTKISRAQSVEEILADMLRYARYYAKIWSADKNNEPNKDIQAALIDLKVLKVEVANPFLLEAYDDYHQGRLSVNDFVAILRLVESYVFRRAVVGIPTNSLNKIFAVLANEINRSEYLISVQRAFAKRSGKTRFPPDTEFTERFKLWDAYNIGIRRKYVMQKLENFNRRELIAMENYSIEHIMPQTLDSNWRDGLGADWLRVHDQYLHTIGNLTLTAYNSELGNLPFEQKRIQFAKSPLYLNGDLAQAPTWDEVQIAKRAQILAERALQIWPDLPRTDQTILPASYHIQPYTLDTMQGGQYFQSETISDLFKALNARIHQLIPTIREEVKKNYVAYKLSTNLLDIIPQARGLKIVFNVPFSAINDSLGRCKDVTGKPKWGNGNIEYVLKMLDELDYVADLIVQAYEWQISNSFA